MMGPARCHRIRQGVGRRWRARREEAGVKVRVVRGGDHWLRRWVLNETASRLERDFHAHQYFFCQPTHALTPHALPFLSWLSLARLSVCAFINDPPLFPPTWVSALSWSRPLLVFHGSGVLYFCFHTRRSSPCAYVSARWLVRAGVSGRAVHVFTHGGWVPGWGCEESIRAGARGGACLFARPIS